MNKVKTAIAIGTLALSSISFAAPAANQSTTTFIEGSQQYLADGRATFAQGFFMGTVLARAYNTEACIPGNSSNKVVLTAVAASMKKSVNMEILGNINLVADAAILAAFPCD